MADYSSIYFARITVDTVTGKIASIELPTMTFYSSTGTFAEGESIFAAGLPLFFVNYLGHIDDGWIGTDVNGYYLFSNVHPTTLSLPLSYSTDPFTVCFLAGTSIATPDGETAVEDLKIGDLVSTSDGRTMPVRWVGRQTVVTFFADALRTLPVRIAAGALGEGMPAQAGALVNGTTITRMTGMPERFSYYHVELEDHSLILAEGVPAETFVDNVTRQRFDNWQEYEALYGEADPATGELEMARIKSERQLPEPIRQRLHARAARLVGKPVATAA